MKRNASVSLILNSFILWRFLVNFVVNIFQLINFVTIVDTVISKWKLLILICLFIIFQFTISLWKYLVNVGSQNIIRNWLKLVKILFLLNLKCFLELFNSTKVLWIIKSHKLEKFNEHLYVRKLWSYWFLLWFLC